MSKIKSDRELKHNFAKAKAVLLSKDPNPPPTKASPAGSQRGRQLNGGRVSALQESASKKFPAPHRGKTGVILNVDYTGGKAFTHLTSEQYAECMARNAKGELLSWKKVDSARDFIRNAKKTTASSSQRDKDAKVSAAVAEQTKSLRKERDRLADGVLSMSEELQSTQKRGRANHKSAKKKKSSKNRVKFADVGSAKAIIKKRRRREQVDSDSDSSESDSDSDSSDDDSMSSVDVSSSRNDKSATEVYHALISSAQKVQRERTSTLSKNRKQKSQRSPGASSKGKHRKDRKKRSR